MSIIEGMCTEYQAGYTEYLEKELKKTERLVRDLTALLESVRAQCNTEREYADAQQDRAIKAEEERDRLQVQLHAHGLTVLTSNEAGNQKMIEEDRARAEELAKAAEADIETRANKAIWTLKEYCQNRECKGCFLWGSCYGEEFSRFPRYWDPPWAKEN